MTSTSAVMHVEADTSAVIRQYLDHFSGESSLAVISDARFDLVRSNSRFAGWFMTDCTTTFEHLPGQAASSTPAEVVIETSGTTGAPKLVRYSKKTLRTCADAIAHSIPLNQDRNYLALVNPRLAYGLSILHSHLLADVPVRFQPAPLSLDSWREFRRALRPNSSIYLVPHQSFLLAQDDSWTFPEPIEFIFAGGAFSELMAARLRPIFPNATVINMYGQAELGPRISIGRSPLSDFREGDVGKALPGVRIRLADNGGSGGAMVEVASPYQMSSYLSATGDPQPPPPVWWPTGDVGHLSANGHIHITGRAADDVNFLGSRIALSHLRGVVGGVDGVLDCRVAAMDHAVYGQQPAIRVLVDRPDPTAERRIRRTLAAEVGTSASAILITVIDIASLPESGKL